LPPGVRVQRDAPPVSYACSVVLTRLRSAAGRGGRSDGGVHQHQLLRCSGGGGGGGGSAHLSAQPLRPLLELFLQCGLYMFTILDDSEVYEMEFPFALTELAKMATFLNQLGFLALWHRADALGERAAVVAEEAIRQQVTKLLAVLYERDSRREFVPQSQWLVADRKLSKEFEKEVMAEVRSPAAVS
jgi:hypothetical protein